MWGENRTNADNSSVLRGKTKAFSRFFNNLSEKNIKETVLNEQV